jgi:branched-chain amino acid transport system permease protein
MVVIMLYRPAGLWPSPNREERPQAAIEHEEAETTAA